MTVASNFRSDTGLANNTNYCYRVSAVDAAGNESGQSNQACAATHGSWTKQWGSTAAEVARGIVRDGSGNMYVAGITGGIIDGQPNAGGVDAFLTKYDSSGTRQWTRLIGTPGTDWGQAVDVDSSGNVYVTGYVSGSFDGKNYYGETDVFLAKYDPAGNRLWYQQWGTSGQNQAYGVKVDGSVVYVTGHTYEYLAGEIGSLVPNIFLSKRSISDGGEIWTIVDGTQNQSDFVEGIALDSAGNIYLAGYTHGAFGGANNGSYDAFLAKYNPSGSRLWVRQWGSAADDFSRAVEVDGSNNIYVTGSVGGSIVGGAAGLGGDDIFLAKYDTNGNPVWTTKLFGTVDRDRAYGITIDDSGEVYLTGATEGNLAGTNLGQGDVFLMKCNAAGALLWTGMLGTSADDNGYGAAFDSSDGYIYVVGNTSGDLDGNVSTGGSDAFLLKYSSSGVRQ